MRRIKKDVYEWDADDRLARIFFEAALDTGLSVIEAVEWLSTISLLNDDGTERPLMSPELRWYFTDGLQGRKPRGTVA